MMSAGVSTSTPVRIVALGGLGEIGLNLMAIECAGSALIVDCGVMFPDEPILGGGIYIPNLDWFESHGLRCEGIILTHAHEDHIGALPYVLDEVDAPVYGSAFTLALVRSKLTEHGLLDSTDLREMTPGAPFEAGPFKIEFIHLTHSIIEAGALAITEKASLVIMPAE